MVRIASWQWLKGRVLIVKALRHLLSQEILPIRRVEQCLRSFFAWSHSVLGFIW